MKRYLIFAGDTYYPCGGWSDLAGQEEDWEKAQQLAAHALRNGGDWAHIVDTQTGVRHDVVFATVPREGL